MTSVFFTIIIAVLYHVYRNHLQWKKRKQQEIDADILWQKGQSVQFMEPLMPPTIKITSYQKVSYFPTTFQLLSSVILKAKFSHQI